VIPVLSLRSSRPAAVPVSTGSRAATRRSRLRFAVGCAVLLAAHTAIVLASLGEVLTVGANVALAIAVLAWARRAGLTRDELGLTPSAVVRSTQLGLVLAVLIATTVGALAPFGVFASQAPPGLDGASFAFRFLVGIPVGTALAEELVFRGVVLAGWRRVGPTNRAIVLTSTVFGLWHVAAEWHRVAGPNVLPAVLATAAASAFILCPLRLWTRSLAAPVIVHAATNMSVLAAVYLTAT